MKLRNLILTLILVIGMMLTTAMAGNGEGDLLAVEASSTTASVGDTVTITVSVVENTNLGTMTYEIVYDADALEYVVDSASKGTVFPLSEINDGDAGTIVYTGISTEPVTAGGKLLSVQFTVKEVGAKVSVSSIVATDENDNEVPANEVAVTIACAHGVATTEMVTKEPTCTESGSKDILCSACGDVVKTEAIEATGHTEGEWTVDKEATCTEAGSKSMACTVCGDTVKTEAIEATGHTEGEWTVDKEATCTEAGSKSMVCTVCGDTVKTEAIEATGHTEGEWTVDKEATCTEAGSKSMACTVCGDTVKTEAIEATGHTEGEWTVDKEAICTEAGSKSMVCTVCGDTVKTEAIEATGHTEGEWTVDKQATCTEAGSKSMTCAVCGEETIEVIEATNHSFGEWVVVEEATIESAGLKERNCQNCQESEREEIPQIELDDSLNTADVSEVILWAGMIMAVGCMAMLVLLNRIKKKMI